ncbi:type VI secretion system baseplate subunit TssK [Luteibacter sp.]|jgi:type VI secretion system protein ImpJ|uniref:type VI secretion system baseplate subunit TssK n=1 Tax=Luteibacter sp. TaxID=1886636 RepID=UPI002F3E99AD
MQKPLWHEGIVLTPQHFQQQELWLRTEHRHLAQLSMAEPWGIVSVDLDEAALDASRLLLRAVSARLSDGTWIDTAEQCDLPEPRHLERDIPDDVREVVVHIALPLLRQDEVNDRTDGASAPRRFRRAHASVRDRFGESEEEISVERYHLRLLFDHESHADDVTCPVLRLVRGGHGRFRVDPSFVPPCLYIDANERHLARVRRVAEVLAARADTLVARRRSRNELAVEFGVSDVSLLWLLHTVQSHWPRLAFLASHPHQSPERLYLALAELAAALMMFSADKGLDDIPAYDHRQQDTCFAQLEAMVASLLDAVIPSSLVVLGLARQDATTWHAALLEPRLREGADFYLAVSAADVAELADKIPQLCKVGAADDIAHVVNAALPGIPLRLTTRLPPALPVRLDTQYFALDSRSAEHGRMLASGAAHVYLPSALGDVSLEIYAVLPR